MEMEYEAVANFVWDYLVEKAGGISTIEFDGKDETMVVDARFYKEKVLKEVLSILTTGFWP